MKVLLANKYGDSQIIETNFIPRVGDKVARFYQPYPTVTTVLCWPAGELLREFESSGATPDLDAIILVD